MADTDPMPLGALLKELRMNRGYRTQAALAAAVPGVQAAMIGHVEAGTRSLGRDSWEAIATALALTDEERARFAEARNRKSEELSVRSVAVKPQDADAARRIQFDGALRALGAELAKIRDRADRTDEQLVALERRIDELDLPRTRPGTRRVR